MRKFEVGQRVRVWFTAGPGEKCNITKVLSPVCLELLDHEGKHAYAHPRQCVRLVPKKPCPPQGERVECWGVSDKNGTAVWVAFAAQTNAESEADCRTQHGRDSKAVHLVELKPGEILVDYDMLASAMDALAPSVFDGVGGALMKKFCAELGVPYPEGGK